MDDKLIGRLERERAILVAALLPFAGFADWMSDLVENGDLAAPKDEDVMIELTIGDTSGWISYADLRAARNALDALEPGPPIS